MCSCAAEKLNSQAPSEFFPGTTCDLLYIKLPFLPPIVYIPRLGRGECKRESPNVRSLGVPSRGTLPGCLLCISFTPSAGPHPRGVLFGVRL